MSEARTRETLERLADDLQGTVDAVELHRGGNSMRKRGRVSGLRQAIKLLRAEAATLLEDE